MPKACTMFKPLGKVVIQKSTPGLARSIEAAVVVVKATECAAGRFQAIRFRNGRLTVVAPSLIAAQELVLRKLAIIEEINTFLGERIVRDLFIRS